MDPVGVCSAVRHGRGRLDNSDMIRSSFGIRCICRNPSYSAWEPIFEEANVGVEVVLIVGPVERLAQRQEILDGQSMVDCAKEMLEITVFLWLQRDRFIDHHYDYDWLVSFP